MENHKSKKDWLNHFRRCSTLDTLEKIYESLREKISSEQRANFEVAADHRRAEIIMNKLYDKVPAAVWRYVK
ncbi:TPA: hemolysin activation protein [Yersinia enterocolitica]|nr:hemolysin activation protein [Yersinia enterocolitica]